MRILFTGFTSRTVGSDRNVYDYTSNVDILAHVLQLAGHEVDRRKVSLETDPCIEEDYDCAVVDVAACNGFSSRFKLGAMWALDRFGTRAGIFPSDGKNVAVLPASVQTCKALGYFYGKTSTKGAPKSQAMLDHNNILDVEIADRYEDVWLRVLNNLPQTDKIFCAWPVLVPAFSWGSPLAFRSTFGRTPTMWDPTRVSIPLQFPSDLLGADGRLSSLTDAPRERKWILSTLQDQDLWLKKQKGGWPVVEIGNRRKATRGEALPYIPEMQLIQDYYTRYAGMLAFAYPKMGGSGWWRMRYVHAALAGCVTASDEVDSIRMPLAFQASKVMIERWSPEKLRELALEQYTALMNTAWTEDETIQAVDHFVRSLVS